MKVFIPDALQSYTDHQRCVDAQGESLDLLLEDLDARYPGIRFRMINEQDEIRANIVIFVDGAKTDRLDTPLHNGGEVFIMQALAGG